MHSVILTYDLLARKSKLVFREVSRIIEEMKRRYGTAEMASVIQVSHRFSPLPGYREELQKLSNQKIIELEKGSGARGLIELKDRFSMQEAKGVSLLTGKPWQQVQEYLPAGKKTGDDDSTQPTHVLYKNRAYPLSAEPLIIAQDSSGNISIYPNDQAAAGSQKNCTIHLSGDDVVLTSYSTEGISLDKTKVSQTALLKLGQTVQLAPSKEELKLIACVRD